VVNGEVDLKWSREENGRLHLRWTETDGSEEGFWRAGY
jgi:two-component sensor histidine kinase